MRAPRLADFEAGQALRLLVLHFDVLHVGVAGAAAHEFDHSPDSILVALEHRLDGAVRAVADPAVDARGTRLARGGVAEEDPLHATVRHDSPADHRAKAVSARNSYAMFAASSAVT